MRSDVSLFVYGAFDLNGVHFPLLKSYVEKVEPAAVNGLMYRLPVGYPVLLSQDPKGSVNSHAVEGTLVHLKANDTLCSILDMWHGFMPLAPQKCLYLKEVVPVTLENGLLQDAVVYFLNPKKLPAGSKILPQAQWKEDLSVNPPLTEFLTEAQSTYIRKLGKSKGRDIVPIKLDLYRELMKLDLIVDKGRRLALSKLGKDVSRYLPSEVSQNTI